MIKLFDPPNIGGVDAVDVAYAVGTVDAVDVDAVEAVDAITLSPSFSPRFSHYVCPVPTSRQQSEHSLCWFAFAPHLAQDRKSELSLERAVDLALSA